MLSFLRRKQRRARLRTLPISGPLHLVEDHATQMPEDAPIFLSGQSLKPAGNEMHVELPVAVAMETQVSTCTIMMEPEGHYKKLGSKPISMDNEEVEPPIPAPRTSFLTKGVTVRITSKPDGDVEIGTKPASTCLPFPTITHFTRLNNWEFNVLVDVPIQKKPETDMTRLKKEVDDGFALLLKATDDIKKAFGVIEEYATKEAALKVLTIQKSLEKQKISMDCRGQSSVAKPFQGLKKDPRVEGILKELETCIKGRGPSSDASNEIPVKLRRSKDAQAKKTSD